MQLCPSPDHHDEQNHNDSYQIDNSDDIFSCLDDLTSTCPALEGEVIKKTKKLLVRFIMTTEW